MALSWKSHAHVKWPITPKQNPPTERKNKAYVLLSIFKSLNCQLIGEIKSKLLMLMKKAQNFMKLLTATFSLGFVIEKLLKLFNFGVLKWLNFLMRLLIMDQSDKKCYFDLGIFTDMNDVTIFVNHNVAVMSIFDL